MSESLMKMKRRENCEAMVVEANVGYVKRNIFCQKDGWSWF